MHRNGSRYLVVRFWGNGGRETASNPREGLPCSFSTWRSSPTCSSRTPDSLCSQLAHWPHL